jgi:ATP-independent RNA helicase DbpA
VKNYFLRKWIIVESRPAPYPSPIMSDSFSQLDLPEAQLSNLESLGYLHMTPIQAEALPHALQGKDLIAQAKTGSGKTAAFALAILARLDIRGQRTQALILCPTRELSIQVSTEIRQLARYKQNINLATLYGGQRISLQKQSLKHGAHIVVGTPGRIKDHLEKGSLNLKHVTTLVLDEADRMLDMGFIHDIETLIRSTPRSRQTLLFSATYPPDIHTLSERFQKNPIRITVDETHSQEDIQQTVYICDKNARLAALKTLLQFYPVTSTVVFCNFKQSTRDVSDFLICEGFSALALHGDLEQRDREEILIQFKHQSASILVATDVAARGLDIKDLPLVINYELPPTPDAYIHRTGRTGRAGNTGMAISLCTERERHKVQLINDGQPVDIDCVPLSSLSPAAHPRPAPPNVSFCIAGGRKDKVRPGEILGALTGEHGIDGQDVGKIDVLDYAAYVAIKRSAAEQAAQQLKTSKIKGRSFKITELK